MNRSTSHGRARHAAVWLALVVFTARVPAQLPVARLSEVFPPGGKAGATLAVEARGQHLDRAVELHFSHSNITATVESENPPEPSEIQRFKVSIGARVPPGVYEARVIGRYGVSNPRGFVVGTLPETAPVATNHTEATALPIGIGTVVNHRTAADAIDFYKLDLKKGQRVLLACGADEIDSRLDPVLILIDGQGREVARERRAGFLDFTATGDGPYLLKLHDFLFRGGPEYPYRLSVSTEPRIDFIFPPAGHPGKKSKVTVYGRMLPSGKAAPRLVVDGRPLEQQSVEIAFPADPLAGLGSNLSTVLTPARAFVDGFEYRLTAGQRVSNPALLYLTTDPIAVEHEPNDRPDQAPTVNVPCEWIGQFYPQRDEDWFRFAVRKGEVYWLEVYSQRLGLPTNPFLLVQRLETTEKGEEKIAEIHEVYDLDTNLGGVEFKTASLDLSWRLEAKADSHYRVMVRDQFNRTRDNPAHVYRLAIQRESPDFRLVALPQAPRSGRPDAREANVASVFLRRGEAAPITVLVSRRHNFTNSIQFEVEGLPAWIRCDNALVAGQAISATLILVAGANARTWAGPIRITGTARDSDGELARSARAASLLWNVPDYNNEAVRARVTRDFLVAVTDKESAPLQLEISTSQPWEASVAGKIKVPVNLERQAGFNGPVKLKASGLTALASAKELEVPANATNATIELDLAQAKLGAGRYSLHLAGQTQGKYRKYNPEELAEAEQAAQAAEDIAKQADKAASELSAAAKEAEKSAAAAAEALKQAETKLAEADQKLAETRAAVEKNSGDAALVSARATAETEQRAAAEKVKEAAQAKMAAAQKATDASARGKEAEREKTEAAARGKQLRQRMEARDLLITAYSPSFILEVRPAPIRLIAETPKAPFKAGAKIEIAVAVQRLFDFNGPVELSLIVPKDAKGIRAAKITVPKGQSETRLEIETAPESAGEIAVQVLAAVKYNNQELKVSEPVKLNLTPAAGLVE